MVVRFHFLHDVWDIKDVEALDNSEHFYDVEHVLTISVQPHHLERDQAHQILDEIGGNVSDRNLGQISDGFLLALDPVLHEKLRYHVDEKHRLEA